MKQPEQLRSAATRSRATIRWWRRWRDKSRRLGS